MDPTESGRALEGAVPEDQAGPVIDDGSVRAAGVPVFTMPLAEWSYVTDRYGADRGIGFIHGGIDLAVEGLENSPVYASCRGTVQTSEYSGSYGNHVVVDCGDEWATLYAHLSSVEVTTGDEVTDETVLGRTGSSGFSTGEHLHFEIILDGKRVNPEHYLDFKIPPGTPLSSGPLYFPGWDEDGPPPTPTDTPTPTATPTDTPIPTATRPPIATETPTPVTPTPKPTNTPTATPQPPTPTATATPTIFIPS
jgi:cell division septation protein DedD